MQDVNKQMQGPSLDLRLQKQTHTVAASCFVISVPSLWRQRLWSPEHHSFPVSWSVSSHKDVPPATSTSLVQRVHQQTKKKSNKTFRSHVVRSLCFRFFPLYTRLKSVLSSGSNGGDQRTAPEEWGSPAPELPPPPCSVLCPRFPRWGRGCGRHRLPQGGRGRWPRRGRCRRRRAWRHRWRWCLTGPPCCSERGTDRNTVRPYVRLWMCSPKKCFPSDGSIVYDRWFTSEKSLKDFNSYLAEAQKGEHGEDGRCQRKDQEMFADAVPLKTSMHQERYQAKRCRGLQTTGQQSSLGHNS